MLSKMVENTEARLQTFRPDEMAALLYGLSHLAASKHVHQHQEQLLLQVRARRAANACLHGWKQRQAGQACAAMCSS